MLHTQSQMSIAQANVRDMFRMTLIRCSVEQNDVSRVPAKHGPIDCEEKVPMAANNAYRARAWECLSLAECMNDPVERAEIIRFARMWMNLAEPIDEAPGSYEFP
jgi:hypothetical protein